MAVTTCGNCRFGLMVQDLTKRTCVGHGRGVFAIVTGPGQASVQFQYPIQEANDPACAVWKAKEPVLVAADGTPAVHQ